MSVTECGDSRLRSVLAVCPERGEAAFLDRVTSFARAHRARVHLVDVVPLSGGEPSTLVRRVDRVVKDRLDSRLAAVRREGLPATARILRGRPFVEIIREVLRNGHDLVVIPPDLRRGLRETLFGSTTLHLLRKCPVPVWVVRSRPSRHAGPVVVGVDLRGERAPAAFDAKLVSLGALVARSEGLDLEVVHCWTVPFEGLLWRAGYGRQTLEVRKLRRETREAQALRLSALLSSVSLEGVSVASHLVHGEADEALARMARRRRAELVVMGTIARTGLAGVFIGNTAERLLSRLGSSILAVKPDGFATPVV